MRDSYWERTLYGLAAWPGEPADVATPLPVKLYRTAAWRPLPAPAARLGDVRLLSPAYGGPDRGTAPLDAGTLLHHAHGYRRWVVSAGGTAAHRTVPSAGRAYPTELYLWQPDGLSYHDPAHHALVPLRPAGRLHDVLGPALGTDLTGAGAAVLVTMRFWKVAYRYGAYGYRLATQEAGMVAGNVLGVAAALGWRGHAHHRFLDAPLARWLGLEPDEEAVAVAIPLYPWDDPRQCPADRPASGTGLVDIPPLDLPYRRPSTMDRQRCAPFLDLDARSRLDAVAGALVDGDPARCPPAPTSQHAPPRRHAPLPADPDGPVVDLADALAARESGPPMFNPAGEPVGAEALWRICRYAAAPHARDVAVPVRLLVATHRVDGVAPDGYLVGPDGTVERTGAGAVVPRLAATVPAHPSPVNFATANAVVSVLADPDEAGTRLGPRAYRILNVEAGIVAQRVCVLAAAAGLVARPYNGYRAEDVARLLGLAGTGLVPLFQIALGRPRPTPAWQLPL